MKKKLKYIDIGLMAGLVMGFTFIWLIHSIIDNMILFSIFYLLMFMLSFVSIHQFAKAKRNDKQQLDSMKEANKFYDNVFSYQKNIDSLNCKHGKFINKYSLETFLKVYEIEELKEIVLIDYLSDDEYLYFIDKKSMFINMNHYNANSEKILKLIDKSKIKYFQKATNESIEKHKIIQLVKDK